MTEITDKDVIIAVMGLTGSGKSTLINLACQSETKLPVGHDVQSCTDTVDVAPPFVLDGRRVFLFDTPGFDDTNKSETEILRIIAIELEKQFRQGITLHGIIYVHRISDIRVGGLAKSNFGIFRKLCGDNSLKNVVIVTNMWSKVTEEEGMRRVAQLASLDDFFKPALEKKARLMHHTRDTVESIHEIIRAIMENHPVPLVIQEELVNEGKDINQTGAGQEVDKKVAALTAEYERKMQEQLAAAEEARRLHDEETRQELLEEKIKNEERLKQLREESARHAEQYRSLQNQLEENRRNAAAERAKIDQLEAAMRAQRISAPPSQPQQAPQQPQQVRPTPQQPATYWSITSGKKHSIWNIKHEYYATIDRDEKYIIARSFLDSGRARQQWVFNKVGQYWTITNVSSGLYMSLDNSGDMKARRTSQQWNIRVIDGYSKRFRLYAVDWDNYVVRLKEGNSGERIDIYEKKSASGEIWEIERE